MDINTTIIIVLLVAILILWGNLYFKNSLLKHMGGQRPIYSYPPNVRYRQKPRLIPFWLPILVFATFFLYNLEIDKTIKQPPEIQNNFKDLEPPSKPFLQKVDSSGQLYRLIPKSESSDRSASLNEIKYSLKRPESGASYAVKDSIGSYRILVTNQDKK